MKLPIPFTDTGSAGILAGGESRRLGGLDKGLVTVGGRALVETVLGSLSPQADEVLISANRNLERYRALGVPVVSDRLGAGPLAGFCELMAHARHDWLLCVPVDTLGLPADWAARFAAALATRPGACIAVLHDGERAHPTFCLVHRSLLDDLRRELAAGHYGLIRWQKRHNVLWVPGPPPANLNTLEDLAALEGLESS